MIHKTIRSPLVFPYKFHCTFSMTSSLRTLTLARPIKQLYRPITAASPAYFNFTRYHSSSSRATPPSPSSAGPRHSASCKHKHTSAMDKDQSRGTETTGLSEWKQRAPYRIHEDNDKFNALYEANCHCGKVKYQLSRKEPLDSKLCHCTTCQTQHGELSSPFLANYNNMLLIPPLYSRALPMGRHLPQRGHQLHQRPPRPRVVRPNREVHRAQASLQSALLVLPQPHHGRGPQHDSSFPQLDSLEDRRGQGALQA